MAKKVLKKAAPAKKNMAKPAKKAVTAKLSKAAAAATRAPAATRTPAAATRTPAKSGRPAKATPAPTRAPAAASRPAAAPVKKPAAPAAKASTPIPRPSAPVAGNANAFNNRPVPTLVTTDGKPKKNQAGINTRDLERFRELLLAKRRELVGDMSQMEREALRNSQGTNLSNLPLHMADMGTDNYEQEFTLGLVEKDRNLLREINQALAKIQDGSYGICEGTGKPISRARLEAQPWARFSIEYARQKEQGFRRIM